jgi:branched-chain amino acid transport system permease protein
VTLCIAIAVDQYEFVQPWVTNQPLQTAAPKLGGLDFSSIDASYGLSTAVFLVVLAVCIALYKSKFYRSASLVRTDPRLAATLGVNARNTRLIAYSVTGALAGLSGGLTAVIVQGASPTSFPLTLSFEFLTVVVLAGPGSLLGVVIAIVGIDGVNQFVATNNVVWLFLTPVLLIIAVTRYPEGLNGHLNHLGRSLATLASRVWHQRGRERQGL